MFFIECANGELVNSRYIAYIKEVTAGPYRQEKSEVKIIDTNGYTHTYNGSYEDLFRLLGGET